MYGIKGPFAAACAACLLLVAGCKTAPTTDTATLSRVALKSVTVIAVSKVVERDDADAAKRAERAARITAIALTLQGLGDDALATLPVVMDAVKPLLDKAGLSVIERQQADILVEALTAAALERVQIDAGNPTYATVRLVLDDVIRAAAYYLPTS